MAESLDQVWLIKISALTGLIDNMAIVAPFLLVCVLQIRKMKKNL